MIRFGQDASPYGTPGPLVDAGHIGSSLFFSLVRATGRRPVRSPGHRDAPSANSVARAIGAMYVSCESPLGHKNRCDLSAGRRWLGKAGTTAPGSVRGERLLSGP
jgi:hypothetical protein